MRSRPHPLPAGLAIAAAILLGAAATPADAAQPRDRNARAAFMREHPCPATGATRGPCPGYVVDHVKPLCAGGADHPSNMQYQTIEDAKIKDRDERRQCAGLRR